MFEYSLSKHLDEITLDGYLDQELSEHDIAMVEAHLEECPACRQYLEARRAFFNLIAESEQVSLSHDISVDVLDTLKRDRKRLLALGLTIEAVLTASLLLLINLRLSLRLRSVFERIDFVSTLIELGETISSFGTQVKAGIAAISQSMEWVPLPGVSSLPGLPFNWPLMSGILIGIFTLWLVINRILIGSASLERTRLT
jgi:predicted anti-sigma-YlaC factor YlaD